VKSRKAIRITILPLAAALALAGCSSAGKGKAADETSTPKSSSEERHASILDAKVKALKVALPAIDVKLASGITVPFKEGEKLRVAFVGYGKGYDYSKPEYAAAKEQAAALGMQVEEFDPSGDAQKQVAQLQDIMASGKYNAVVTFPLSPDLTCDLMTRQMPQKGILTAVIGSPACTVSDTPGVVTTVADTGYTDYVYTEWAKEIAATQKAGGKAILLVGPQLDYSAKLAIKAANTVFKEKGIELLDTLYTDFTQPDSLQKAQNALQRHADATLIASAFPEGTQASISAVRLAGRQGKVNIFDFGSTEQALDAIEKGTVAGSTPFYSYTKVKTALQALLLARHGEKVDPYFPYSGHAPESMRPADAKVMFVNKDNVKAFKELVAE
jgi:ABC-type sugar transport system substrate-binding protein